MDLIYLKRFRVSMGITETFSVLCPDLYLTSIGFSPIVIPNRQKSTTSDIQENSPDA